MSQPIHLDLLSSSDEDVTDKDGGPSSNRAKRPKTNSQPNPTSLIIVDDPTPQKLKTSLSTPSFVPDTPLSDFQKSEVTIIKCTAGSSNPRSQSSNCDRNFSGVGGLICLESDNESEDALGKGNPLQNEITTACSDVEKYSQPSPRFTQPANQRNGKIMQMCEDNYSHPSFSEDDTHQISSFDNLYHDKNTGMEELTVQLGKSRAKGKAQKKMKDTDEIQRKKRNIKEEKLQLMEEKKLKKEQEKLQKAALKAEAAKLKKMEIEMHKWEKGKFAVKSIVAEIDTKVVELGLVGGHMLTRFADKDIRYRITSNPIERSIVWTMTVPEQISQFSSSIGTEIPYVLLVYEADELCKLALNESLFNHVSAVQSRYPSYTICYLTNRLMSYINKREHEKYKNPASTNDWRRPPVEEVFAKLTTHFEKVHSRHCVDEAELAEHVVGLTRSLANCQFRKKLTRLSVSANGAIVPKDCADRNLILKSPWLKALIAIPKVQPRFAIAIWKKYPTMKSLLSIYMDPLKPVHEKEFLLKDLTIEGLIGNEDRRLALNDLIMSFFISLCSDMIKGLKEMRGQIIVVLANCHRCLLTCILSS
ncbi:hypothetical protein Nepgr_025830 [Nepenthes gracilis]|uniref:ERCC4 domain-containing protein n=1 Tax=Nepenthes gracilis TaxID=150966 RepID=A0AAD3T8M2_NEPGR|nr:hypothetical protein Nepgr_025830 [Nepenthes gracilis]